MDQLDDEEFAKARFDGSVHGWRLGTHKRLEALGLRGRNLQPRSCRPTPAGAETETELDFTVTYMPTDPYNLNKTSHPDKWICGTEALSVMVVFTFETPFGGAEVWIQRTKVGRRVVSVNAAFDRIEASEVNGLSAILVHQVDDSQGFGDGRVIVIEDDTTPEFTVLQISTETGIPFAELLKIARGVEL